MSDVTTPLRALLDQRLDGQLDTRLRYWNDHGVAAEAMARLLHTETGVKLSGETVRRWLRCGAPA